MTTATRPAFRKPWENGAKAYPEADTFAAALEGFKRRRKNVMFHMPSDSEGGTLPCAVCALSLSGPDDTGRAGEWATYHYIAHSKRIAGGMHYGCSWSALLTAVLRLV